MSAPTTLATTCRVCGFRNTPSTPRPDRRRLVPVVDETGSSAVCGLCVITLVTRPGVTLFVEGRSH